MSFIDFLTLIRERIGKKCPDGYWEKTFNSLKDKSREAVERELPFLAIRATAQSYFSKESYNATNRRKRSHAP